MTDGVEDPRPSVRPSVRRNKNITSLGNLLNPETTEKNSQASSRSMVKLSARLEPAIVERVIKGITDLRKVKKLKEQEEHKLKKRAVWQVVLHQRKVFANINQLFKICEKTKPTQQKSTIVVKEETNVSLNSGDSLSSYEQERLTQGLN